MFSGFYRVWNFLNYWYFRYLMVTELYMVEGWERAIVNTIIVTLFVGLTYLNYLAFSFTSSLIWNTEIPPTEITS